MKKVSIHQPNFFPWLGYFDKLHKSDIFIFLDDVQFEKKGGTWANRVYVQINGKRKWLTVPVIRNFSGVRKINEIMFSNKVSWKKKIINKLENYYRNSLFFNETISEIKKILEDDYSCLSSFNIKTIKYLLNKLNLNKPKFFNSSAFDIKTKSNQRLIDLLLNFDSTIYYSGKGSIEYLDEKLFFNNSIDIIYQNFKYVEYTQNHSGPFITKLSVIDVLMNCGFNQTERLIKSL